jgi:mono/diheme cytochrome c family protein
MIGFLEFGHWIEPGDGAALVEVPEHLLQRSRDRRAALGLGGEGGAAPAAASDEGSAAPATQAEAAPAAAAAAPTPAVPEAPPPPPPPYVQAALDRRRIPYWVMPVVFLLPLWVILYAGTLSEADTGEPTQVELGGELYAENCASCHGGTGGGGVGPALSGGTVLETFPTLEDHLAWVAGGSESAVGGRYGSELQKESKGGMPTFFGQLTEAEILAIVRFEREVLSGEEVDPTRIDADENLLHEDGSPFLDATGEHLVDPAGERLFDDEGTFVAESQQAIPLGTGEE